MNHLAIPVRDQELSRRFYETYLGFGARPAKTYEDGVLMLYDATGFALGLRATGEPIEHPGWMHFGVGLSTAAAVRALAQRLTADGVELAEEHDEPDYVSVKCRDPDGYLVEAFWEPLAASARDLRFQIDEYRYLRLLEESDGEELDAVVQTNREYLARWMPWAAGQTGQETLEFIRSTRRQLAENQGFHLAIVEAGGIVGVIGFHRLDWPNRSTSIGYWIAESSQRRGTVTAAVRAITDYAFREWQLNRVEIRAGLENHRSRAVPARLGFVEEGVLREAERVGNGYMDHVVYSMLTTEWKSPPPPGRRSKPA